MKLGSGRHQQKVGGNSPGGSWTVLPRATIYPAKVGTRQAKVDPTIRECLLLRQKEYTFFQVYSGFTDFEELKKKMLYSI